MAIYLGILAVSRNARIRHFAREHLARLGALLPLNQRSVFLPLWRVAGWLTGFLPALFGPRAAYATSDAVETFADHHYEDQIRKLPADGPGGELRALLMACQADEVHHRDEARAAGAAPTGSLTQAWQWLVGSGSPLAVAAARRVLWPGGEPFITTAAAPCARGKSASTSAAREPNRWTGWT